MKRLRLGDHATITVGHPFQSKRFTSAPGIRLLRGANVKRGTLDWSANITRHWPAKEDCLAAFELHAGDIVIAMDGALVGMSCARLHAADLPAYLVQRVARVRCMPLLDQSFAFHILASGLFQKHVTRRKTHTAIPHITKRDIEDFQLPAHPVAVQRKIGALLDRVDQAVALLGDLYAARDKQRKYLSEGLLSGRVRLSAYGDPAGHAGALSSWHRCRLEDVADVSFSPVDKVTRPGETSVRLCNYMDVWKHDYIDDAMIEDRGSATEREVIKFTLQPGDVVLTKDSETREDIGSTAVVRTIGPDVVLGYHLALVRPKPGLANGGFLAKQLNAPSFRRQFVRAAAGATRYGLGITTVRRAEVLLPTIDEQAAIAGLLELVDSQLSLLAADQRALRRLKQTLTAHVTSSSLPDIRTD